MSLTLSEAASSKLSRRNICFCFLSGLREREGERDQLNRFGLATKIMRSGWPFTLDLITMEPDCGHVLNSFLPTFSVLPYFYLLVFLSYYLLVFPPFFLSIFLSFPFFFLSAFLPVFHSFKLSFFVSSFYLFFLFFFLLSSFLFLLYFFLHFSLSCLSSYLSWLSSFPSSVKVEKKKRRRNVVSPM